jgi:CDP-diacylglycerol--glycerol-3-phosphate 3-phosphatidyltransferase
MPSLYNAKAWYTRRLDIFIRAAVARGWSPDVFTVIGVLFAVLAAAALLLGWWPLVILGLIGRLGGANLDGAVARARGVSRPFGFVLNELGDRLSDMLPFAALAIIAYRDDSMLALTLVLVAALAASLPTFISLAMTGAGVARMNGGYFGKTERCLTIALTAIALAYLPQLAVLEVASGIIILGSLLTVWERLHRGRKVLAS